MLVLLSPSHWLLFVSFQKFYHDWLLQWGVPGKISNVFILLGSLNFLDLVVLDQMWIIIQIIIYTVVSPLFLNSINMHI